MTKEELRVKLKEKLEEREVLPESGLKQMLLDYVGENKKPEDGKITVDMIISVMADEFPEFVLVMAEQNFVQGYKQAFSDMEKYNSQKTKGKKEESQEHKNG